MKLVPLSLLLLAFGVLPAAAQHDHAQHDRPAQSPYAALESRTIKALAPEQVKGYLEGHGMSMALPAELNGYPGPKHVLELSEELGLTAEQKKVVKGAFDQMRSEAVPIGRDIVELEKSLDVLFASGRASSEELYSMLERSGELQGALRFVHLNAHIVTRSVLSDEQVRTYAELRGYAAEGQ